MTLAVTIVIAVTVLLVALFGAWTQRDDNRH
jgi:hypothetical protein